MTGTRLVPDLKGKRVLILEDDYHLAMELENAMERAGATVLGPFARSRQALSALQRESLDCALVDLNLGQGPDFEVPRVLQALGTPFLFVTGYDEPTIPLEFAATKRLEKPVDPQQIATAVAEVLLVR
jgi:DNA-binding response OmpR family regulator